MGKGGHDPYHPTSGRGVHQPHFQHEQDLDHYHPQHLQHKKLRHLKLGWKARLWLTFEEPEFSYKARFISFLLNCCIFLSVIAFILSTMKQFQHAPHHCHPFAIVGHVCYGPNGEVTHVVQRHEPPIFNEGPRPQEGALPVADDHHGDDSHHDDHEEEAAAGAAGKGKGEGKGKGGGGGGDHHRFLLQQSPSESDFYYMGDLQPSHLMATGWEQRGLAGGAAAGAGGKGDHGAGHGECHPVCEPEPIHAVEAVEMFAMAFFTIDYLIRLCFVHAVPYRLLDSNGYHRKRAAGHYREPSGLHKTVVHFFHAMNLVDLLALVPYYVRTLVERIFPSAADSGILRVFRLLRIFRVAPFYMHMVVSTHGVVKSGDTPHFMHFDLTWFFDLLKIGEYAEGAPLIFWTVKSSFPAVAVAILATVILTIAMGTLMYMAEHGVFQVTPEHPTGAYLVPANYTTYGGGHGALVESPHTNIFMSMYYIVSDTTTMTTDLMLVPHSAPGMAIDVLMDYVALMILTMPIAIIIRNFHEQYEYFFKSWEDEEEEEWDEWSDGEDNEEAILFGYLDEGNLQMAAKDEEAAEDEEIAAAAAARTANKAEPWVTVEKGEGTCVSRPSVAGAGSRVATEPPTPTRTPGPEEEEGEAGRSEGRVGVKIQ